MRGDRFGRAGTAKDGGISGDRQTVLANSSSLLSCRIEICEFLRDVVKKGVARSIDPIPQKGARDIGELGCKELEG